MFSDSDFNERSEFLVKKNFPIHSDNNGQIRKEDIPELEHTIHNDVFDKKNEKLSDQEEFLQPKIFPNGVSQKEKHPEKCQNIVKIKKAKRGRKRKSPENVQEIGPFRFITEIDELNNYNSKKEENDLKKSENNLNEDLVEVESIFNEEKKVQKTKVNTKICFSELRKEASDKRIRIKGRFVTRSQAFVYLGITPYEIASNKEMQDIFMKYSGYSILTKAQNEVKIRNLQTLLQRSFKDNKLPEVDPLNKIEIRILNENKTQKQIEISIHRIINIRFPNLENQSLNSNKNIQSNNKFSPSKFPEELINSIIFKISRPKIIDVPLEHLLHHRNIMY